MSSESTNKDNNPEYIVSGPPLKDDTDLDDGELIELELEKQAVFKRLADDIYKSDEAGIREPLSNSITAVIQAQERFGVENPQIEITVVGEERPEIIISDNGIGIPEKVLREVLAVIGRSMNRNTGEVSGKYGMGFLACYKLVGMNGGFIMHTRSRKTGNCISGLWTSGGFYKDPDDFDLTNPFEENDTYGTQFEFISKKSITKSDVREWVKNSSEWSRLPVLYREFNEDGEEVYNEDYGNKTLTDPYNDDSYTVSYETEYFDAYSSEDSCSKTLLLDSPIGRNYNVYSSRPWNIDIRIKNENGVVVEGPNKGLQPIEDSEYEELPEEKRTDLMKESNLTDDDICVPNPIGTRDSLERNSEFWNWLDEKINHKYLKLIANITSKLTGDFDSFTQLDTTDQRTLMRAVASDILPGKSNDITQKLQEYDGNIDAKVGDLLIELKKKYKVIKREGFSYYSSSIDVDEYVQKRAWRILPEDPDAGVWMACRPTPDKTKVVFEDNENNKIVKVDSSDAYKELGNKFGWKKLGNIGNSNIDEFDITEDIREKFDNSSDTSENNRLKLYYTYHGKNKSKKKSIDNIRQKSENSRNFVGFVKKLIVFPRTDEQNLGEYKWLRNNRIAVASCSTDEFEHLKPIENVIRAKEYINNAKNKILSTSNGKLRASEIDFENDIFHLVSEEDKQLIKEKNLFDSFQTHVESKFNKGIDNSVIYVPVTRDELDELRPLFTQNEYSFTTTCMTRKGRYDIGRCTASPPLTKIYIDSNLPNWKNNPQIEALKDSKINLDEGGIELIDALKVLHDKGLPLNKNKLERFL